uniref:rhophilin-1 n=1 Tax=Gasterosteus aculeatus aculeatus TaxID=481459 RepID=UPI001A98A6EB|nr:rhophilin-1 [Gasterosteus aculeatus aculeatus]XP_040040521.1 rhophilin-1 [Gasterosteus aculeatus aculeatus]XP_040040522.1 rhophilin-1 [Gasterosteus aculeatus aculeatus]
MEEPAARESDMSLSDGNVTSDDEMPLTLPTDGSLSGSTRKGCDPFAQTQRSKLQHRRSRINQQINKEMRMRAGAENLFRATTNNKVKETVALELSFVNSNLQLLKEELEELNSNMEVYQTDSEAINVPMIPLGLKETKEVDFTVPIQDFICEHYGEDSSLYDKEITELMELRQAMRTPSRNQAGLELLMEYYNQLYYLDQRFFPLHKNLGVHFQWYDSLTGVPSCQRTLAFEKGSVLFNIGALYTQIGARQDRSATAGIDRAIDAFQRAAGAFNFLKENFSNAPSLDMSAPSLCMLVRLMVSQVQECVFERVTLTTEDTHFTSQLRLAQEAARVSDVYLLVQQTMTQPLMKDYVPFSWASMVQVKSEHFRALSHYYAAAALCDHTLSAEEEECEEEAEKAFLQFYVGGPAGPPLSQVLRDPEKRRKLGKAHLRRAVIRHEEAMRVHSLCKILRKMDILQDVLSLTHKRSLDKYSELDREDDFDETAEAPEIQSQTHQKPDITPTNFSKVQVTDFFQRLGPLSVFCARARWDPVRVVCLQRRDGGLGLTLRGDSPVLVAGVVAGGCAAEAGLREGDYIVAVDGQDCKWAKHGEVVQMLKSCSERGVELSVVTLHSHDTQLERRGILLTTNSDKENTRQRLPGGAKGQSSASLLNWNRKKTREGSVATKKLGSTFSLSFGSIRDTEAMY